MKKLLVKGHSLNYYISSQSS